MDETLDAIFTEIQHHLETEDMEALKDNLSQLKWTMVCLLAIQRDERVSMKGGYQTLPVDFERLNALNRGLNKMP